MKPVMLNKTIINSLLVHPFGSSESLGSDARVIVKYDNPVSSDTWLITEGETNKKDWLLYGYKYTTHWKSGFVYLSDLEKEGYIRDTKAHGLLDELMYKGE